MDEKTAITLMKQGSMRGLEHLVRQYQHRAVQAAFFILQDRMLAEETVQSAFIKVFERIYQFQTDKPFFPWLARIVINDAIKLAKKNSRSISLDEEGDEARQMSEWLMDPQPSVEDQVMALQNIQVLKQALMILTPNQRAAVAMRYFLDMSEAEMAARFEKPASTVKWWLYATRKRLHAYLKPADGTGE